MDELYNYFSLYLTGRVIERRRIALFMNNLRKKIMLSMIRNVEHLGIKFLCDLCEYIGRNQSELKKHKAKRHEGRFIFPLELFDIFSVIYIFAILWRIG